MLVRDMTDNSRPCSERMLPHHGQKFLHGVPWYHGDQFPLVRHEERIKTEQITHRSDFVFDRDSQFMDLDSDT